VSLSVESDAMPEHGHKPTTCDSFVAMEERGAREAYGSVSTLQVLAVLCTQDYGGRRATIRVHSAKKCQDPPAAFGTDFSRLKPPVGSLEPPFPVAPNFYDRP